MLFVNMFVCFVCDILCEFVWRVVCACLYGCVRLMFTTYVELFATCCVIAYCSLFAFCYCCLCVHVVYDCLWNAVLLVDVLCCCVLVCVVLNVFVWFVCHLLCDEIWFAVVCVCVRFFFFFFFFFFCVCVCWCVCVFGVCFLLCFRACVVCVCSRLNIVFVFLL